MAIYVIDDLRLSFSQDKPMSIFGEKTGRDTAKKIKNNWISKVKPEDTVVLPGDFFMGYVFTRYLQRL